MNKHFWISALASAGLLAATGAHAGTLFFNTDTGLYRLNRTTGAATFVADNGVAQQNVGLAAGPNNTLFAASPGPGPQAQVLQLDAAGNQIASFGLPPLGSFYLPPEGLAYDLAANRLYATTDGVLVTYSFNGASFATVAGGFYSGDHEGADFGNGRLYTLSNAGVLYTTDTTTLARTQIGSIGFNPFGAGLAYDSDLGALFMVSNHDRNLYRIDPTTAAVSLVGATGLSGSTGGLAYAAGIPEPPAGGVPEPITWALMIVGLGSVGLALRRHRPLAA